MWRSCSDIYHRGHQSVGGYALGGTGLGVFLIERSLSMFVVMRSITEVINSSSASCVLLFIKSKTTVISSEIEVLRFSQYSNKIFGKVSPN